MNALLRPFAEVTANDRWMPNGFAQPEEARLGEAKEFLGDAQRDCVTSWWLQVRRNANTPNWDFVSTCTIGGQRGLVLLEAKAHAGELNSNDRCAAANEQNRKCIVQAIEEANGALGKEWSLKTDRCYQLSNRFAWAWKVASLGIPVALVYFGFLKADEMRQPFSDHADWERCLLQYAQDCVSQNVWNTGPIMVNRTPLIPLIRSANVNVVAS